MAANQSHVQVRQKEIEDTMERQFKQGMAAPDWDMDDYGWQAPLLISVICCMISTLRSPGCLAEFACTCRIGRGDSCRRPTFFPAGKLRQLDKEAVLQDKRVLTLYNFVTVLADLSYPKAALTQLQDVTYMLALEDGIRAALDEQPGDHVAASLFCFKSNCMRYLTQSHCVI